MPGRDRKRFLVFLSDGFRALIERLVAYCDLNFHYCHTNYRRKPFFLMKVQPRDPLRLILQQ